MVVANRPEVQSSGLRRRRHRRLGAFLLGGAPAGIRAPRGDPARGHRQRPRAGVGLGRRLRRRQRRPRVAEGQRGPRRVPGPVAGSLPRRFADGPARHAPDDRARAEDAHHVQLLGGGRGCGGRLGLPPNARAPPAPFHVASGEQGVVPQERHPEPVEEPLQAHRVEDHAGVRWRSGPGPVERRRHRRPEHQLLRRRVRLVGRGVRQRWRIRR
mmetsp:Transcript_100982/g.308802  ORF Transcript_100982/g.308802 Transcript_100982/m.308802 type:complete len:213 (-) Transcript_100982:510-1148(-)